MSQLNLLMDLPLELRHNVFVMAAARPEGPKKVLQRWFEKKEVKELIEEEQTANPGTFTPQVIYSDDMNGHQSWDEDDDTEEDREEEDDDDSDDGDEDREVNDDEDGDEDGDEGQVTDATEDVEMEDAQDDGQANSTTSPPVRVFQPHHKWRHIPNFLHITDCPPPVNLFLTSKTLAKEAKDWFYDVAFIGIDATGSFAHTSMFEEAIDQIVDAAFSPFESIRKIEVSFVWDTEWLRDPDRQGIVSFFHYMLGLRVDKIATVLSRSPDLKTLKIIWHDSVNDAESTHFREEMTTKLMNTSVNIKMEHHFLTPGEKPSRNTPLGKKRLEFRRIADEGYHLT